MVLARQKAIVILYLRKMWEEWSPPGCQSSRLPLYFAINPHYGPYSYPKSDQGLFLTAYAFNLCYAPTNLHSTVAEKRLVGKNLTSLRMEVIDECMGNLLDKTCLSSNRIVGLWVSVSHDLAAVSDACAHAGNTCLREHYMYKSYIISKLLIRILLV